MRKISFQNIKTKKIAVAILIVALVVTGFIVSRVWKNKNNQTKYLIGRVTKGNITVTVSGSGKVTAVNQVDLKFKASGTLTYLGVHNGQKVTAGTLLAKLDTTDAERAVKTAQLNLENAQLALTQAQNSTQIDENSLKSQALANMTSAVTLTKNIISSFNDIFFTDISDYKVDAKNLLEYYSHIVTFYARADADYATVINSDFNLLKQQQNENAAALSKLNQNSSLNDIQTVLDQIITTTTLVKDTTHLGYQLLVRYESILSDYNLTPVISPRNISTDKTTVAAYVSNIDSLLTTLLANQKTIKNFKDNQNNSPYSLRSAQIAVEQQQNALVQAKDKLKDYYLYAPFDGELSQIKVSVGDDISSGTTIGVLVTDEKIAEITLNEIDLAKVQIGDTATLTFDALPDLTVSGKVIEIDPVGVESQGVVSYTVKLSLDTTDNRLKPGMTVDAEIMVASKQDVLLVPNSALKSQNGSSYVELVASQEVANLSNLKSPITLTKAPSRQPVQIGLADDNNTEIVSGLKEGDYVVIRTVTPNSITNITTRTGLFNNNMSNMMRNSMPTMGGGFPR
ncbi:MAG: Efflux transporter periplasmic adaptor subunit [Patescibacteria group bacterium]|nr:Efflux transporter periplasmic adaptor subunit [Patescibacteria group bacterium]